MSRDAYFLPVFDSGKWIIRTGGKLTLIEATAQVDKLNAANASDDAACYYCGRDAAGGDCYGNPICVVCGPKKKK